MFQINITFTFININIRLINQKRAGMIKNIYSQFDSDFFLTK
jgi:hypothetical protein